MTGTPVEPADAAATVGFVGLGNMGSVLAANLVQAGYPVVAHDAFAPERTPDGAVPVPDVGAVARRAGVVVLSLPDGAASQQVAQAIVRARAAEHRTTHVVDTSTIGVDAAQAIAAALASAGVAYVDAPVSGGVAGARARTLLVMYAGTDDACAHVAPVLAGLSDRRHRVGDRPGLAQAMKLANNFLSATALAATSEAIAFGRSVGLDMATMLDVLNGSSGQSAATSDKFPDHVLTGRYASGFGSSLMRKDVRLYLQAVHERGGPAAIGAVTASVWERFAAAEPGADFTRIFPFVEAHGTAADAEAAAAPTSGEHGRADADADADVRNACARTYAGADTARNACACTYAGADTARNACACACTCADTARNADTDADTDAARAATDQGRAGADPAASAPTEHGRADTGHPDDAGSTTTPRSTP